MYEQSVIDGIVDQLTHFLRFHCVRMTTGLEDFPPIRCHDGFLFSIHVGYSRKCIPQNISGPWSHVEVRSHDKDAVTYWWDSDEFEPDVYVPLENVAREILRHSNPDALSDLLSIELFKKDTQS